MLNTFIGAPGMIRTYDTRIRNPVLYPLSYGGYMTCRRTFYTNSYFSASNTPSPVKTYIPLRGTYKIYLTVKKIKAAPCETAFIKLKKLLAVYSAFLWQSLHFVGAPASFILVWQSLQRPWPISFQVRSFSFLKSAL